MGLIGTDWDFWIAYSIFYFNTFVHESTGLTPHEIVFGKKARIPSEFAKEKILITYNALVDEMLKRLEETESLVADRLISAKERCKYYYDRKLNQKTFEIGEYVYLLKENRQGKLDEHYDGPFKIIQILSNLNVELRITEKKTQIVHVNR